MQSLLYTLNSNLESLEAAHLEAQVRQIKGVISACYRPQEHTLKVTLDGSVNKLKVKAALYRVLMRGYVQTAKDLVHSAHSTLTAPEKPQSQKSVPDDIGAELEHHKKSALISIVGLGAFAILRRVNPTLYASTTMLRSALVLLMSMDLLRSGIKDAWHERRPNAETLTVTAIIASVLVNSTESSTIGLGSLQLLAIED